jgi:large subunit ribosomal protein L19
MNNTEIIELLKPKLKHKAIAPKVGDIIKVHQIIKEKGKERVQIFEGLVIMVKKPKTLESTYTVRRVVSGCGVERTFPLNSPHVQKIEKVSSSHVRQAKLFYVRKDKTRLRESKKTAELSNVENPIEVKKSKVNELPKESNEAEVKKLEVK